MNLTAKIRLAFPPVLALLFLLITLPLAAQSAVSDDEVNAVAEDLYCPVCENTPLDVCATQACADWRELIREKLSLGQSEADIQDYFVDQYGEGVLATPQASGFNLIVWVFPVLAVVLGGTLFVRYVRGIRTAVAEDETSHDQPTAAPDPDNYIARVEAELRER